MLRSKSWIVIGLLVSPWFQHAFAETASSPRYSGARDFLEYWAAGRLLLYGGNPYSPEELFQLQKGAGWTDTVPVIMWNPPWTLSFTAPFGLFSYTTAQFIWLLFHVSLILLSVRQLWCIYGGAGASSRVPLLLAVAYVPTVFVLIIGQISPLILAGLTAFLYFERRKSPFAAGASAAILSIKPHLLYLFWIVFALWLWRERQKRIVLGALLLGLIIATIPLLFDAQVYSQYFALYKIADIPRPLDWLTPTLRTATRVFIGPDHIWLQFAPSIAGVVWILFHWYSHKAHWEWPEQLPSVVLVSVVTSFFAWTYDQVVFFPAIVEATIWIRRQSTAWHNFWAVRIYIAINVCHAIMRIWVADELWYYWLAPSLLLTYVIFLLEKQRSKHG
jgi:Glycosyltransferase family 87